MNNINISKNFKLREFQCKDGSQLVKIDGVLVQKLQQLRDKIGRPIVITSAYRTTEYNRRVGGAINSQHVLGKAVDISVSGMTPNQVAQVAETMGFGGIGIHKTFVHLDTRSGRSRWNG